MQTPLTGVVALGDCVLHPISARVERGGARRFKGTDEHLVCHGRCHRCMHRRRQDGSCGAELFVRAALPRMRSWGSIAARAEAKASTCRGYVADAAEAVLGDKWAAAALENSMTTQ